MKTKLTKIIFISLLFSATTPAVINAAEQITPTDTLKIATTLTNLKHINDELNNDNEFAKELLRVMTLVTDKKTQQKMLYEASSHGFSNLVKSLLEKNVDPNYERENARTLSERTPLGIAIINEDKKIASLLREAGAKEPFIQLDQLNESCITGHHVVVMIPKGTPMKEITANLEKAGMDTSEENKEKTNYIIPFSLA